MGSDNQPHNPDTEHLYPTKIPSYSLATNPSASSPGIPLHTTDSTTGSSVLEFHVSGAMQLYSWILYSTRYCRDSPILLCVGVDHSHYSIIILCVNRPQWMYPFYCWWTLGILQHGAITNIWKYCYIRFSSAMYFVSWLLNNSLCLTNSSCSPFW